jgi:cytidine deaminase
MTQLDAELQTLIDLATQAAENAWCPYSRFRVGAAVETADGSMFSGCNVENASSGLAICAERNAVFQAVSSGHTKIRRVVVFTPTQTPTTPCGACRQVLSEFSADAAVLCVCLGPDSISTTLAELLPLRFGPGDLEAPESGSAH